MNIFTKILSRLGLLELTEDAAAKGFGVKLISSREMRRAIKLWDDISRGAPPWLDPSDDVVTINMAKFISDTRAKLTTLDIGITVSGDNARVQYLQDVVIKSLLDRLPEQLCEADRLGGMMIRWNGDSWDFVRPGSFGITEIDSNHNVIGAIFAMQVTQNKDIYTRLEYHRFEKLADSEDSVYRVSNKAYRNTRGPSGSLMLGNEVPLAIVKQWAHIEPEVTISGLTKPLFAYYRVPGANIIDPSSPYGTSIFSDAIQELEDIDLGISRKSAEIADSKHITFIGQTVKRGADNRGIKLPRYVQELGIGINDDSNESVREHTATVLTEQRLRDINFNLSMAGVKCGFSEGVFVLDGQRGAVTATQIESDDRDTIQTIKNERDALQAALEQAIEGANATATLMNAAPLGDYELEFHFGDITYSYEEDKANWKMYVQQGWVPKWMYFVRFEKMSEDEAKAMIMEAQQADMEIALFQQELLTKGGGA